jgi:NarL family two-component system response regulator LiaR
MSTLARIAILDRGLELRDSLQDSVSGRYIGARSFMKLDEAEAVFGRLAPDVVILGLHSPIPRGLEAARQIKKLWPRAKLIIVADLKDEIPLLDVLASGAEGYLTRPSFALDLAKAIEAVLAGGVALSPLVTSQLVKFFVQNSARRMICSPILTRRETEIMGHVAAGMVDKEIATLLSLSVLTVKRHLHNIYGKLGVENRIQAINRLSTDSGDAPSSGRQLAPYTRI